MRGSTLPFAPTNTYGSVTINLIEKWNLFFFSLSPIRFSLSLFAFYSFFLFFPLSFSYPPELPFFGLFSFSFLFHFPFSLFSHFLFSFFSLIFLFSSNTFLFLLLIFFPQPNLSKWRKLHPTFLLATCHLMYFLDFLYFFFLLYYIIQHMAQCEPCIPSAPHGSCHVSLP